MFSRRLSEAIPTGSEPRLMIPCRETSQEKATFPGVSLRSTPRLNTDDALRATPHRGALTRKPLQGRVRRVLKVVRVIRDLNDPLTTEN